MSEVDCMIWPLEEKREKPASVYSDVQKGRRLDVLAFSIA